MRIQLLSNRQTFGAAVDVAIWKEVLSDHDVTYTDISQGPSGTFDLNLLIADDQREVEVEHHLATAHRNIFVPNPEMTQYIPPVDALFAKTRDGEKVLRETGLRTIFTSFTSHDHYDSTVERTPTFYHQSGRSFQKGIEHIIDLWEREGEELPHVECYFHPELVAEQDLDLFTVPNLTKNCTCPYPEEIIRLQNANQFHLCPSSYEGFGHSINEAKSVGAIIVTTDGPPMNELVTPDFGFLVAPERIWKRNLATVSEAGSLRPAIDQILALTPDEIAHRSHLARQSFLDNDALFRRLVVEALEEVMG